MGSGTIVGIILLFLYGALGYWAAEKTIWSGKMFFGRWTEIRFQKQITAMFLGWLLIPAAIVKVLRSRW